MRKINIENYTDQIYMAENFAFAATPTGNAGSHNHTFTTDSTGSSGTNANLPPYYALCYIMKS